MSKEPTLEELIALATQPKAIKKVDSSPDAFIKAFGIESGEYKIRRKFLYDLYVKWSAQPKNSSAFNIACLAHVKSLQTDKNIYYLLNKPDSELIKMSLYITEKK
jgi:hypothetical protein